MITHQEIRITFQPAGRSVFVLPGTLIIEAAAQAGIILQTPCGGLGTCGKCRIRIVSGSCDRKQADPKALPEQLAGQGYALACHTCAMSDSVIDIPTESMFETKQQILTSDSGTKSLLAPSVRKTYFELPVPSGTDAQSDVSRLQQAIGDDIIITPELIRGLPVYLRSHRWRGTAVIARGRLISLEGGNTTNTMLGIAFDLGTTTVVGTVINLVTGKELGVAARLNGQVQYGDDVVSRIKIIRQNASALLLLQQAIVQTINQVLGDLIMETKIAASSIYEVTVAGNSTMQEIFCGYDPLALGEMPFIQVFDKAQTLPASSIRIHVNRDAEIFVFPQIAGFVGGDTIAGMLAARIDTSKEPTLLIDIGTNGEIVLANNKRIYAASTAAGPAFEGARITQGMRATTGAIEKVIIARDVQYNVIGNVPPGGMCGTALIDAVAGLLRAGIIDPTGRILKAEDLQQSVPVPLRIRLTTRNNEIGFILVRPEETASGEPVCLWQKDVRELQLASAAIRAGIAILLKRAGLKPADIGTILLAGAFGNFIRRGNARRIGLLPQIPCDRIRFIGNAASLGAKMALVSVNERMYAEELRKKTEHVDLSLDPEFQSEFSDNMMFPENDIDSCDANT